MANNKTKKVPASGHNTDNPNVRRNSKEFLLNKRGEILIRGNKEPMQYTHSLSNPLTIPLKEYEGIVVPKYSVGGDITYGSQYTADKIKSSDVNTGAFTALNLLKGGASGALAGAGLGATIGSIAPGIGTAIGAGIGLLVGGIQSIFGVNKKKKALAEAKEANRVATIANMSQKAENDIYNLRQNTQVSNVEPIYYAFGGRYPRIVRFANGGITTKSHWQGAGPDYDGPTGGLDDPGTTGPGSNHWGLEIDNDNGGSVDTPIGGDSAEEDVVYNTPSNKDAMGNDANINDENLYKHPYKGYITDQLTKINIATNYFKQGDEFSEAIAAIASMQGEGELDKGDYNQFAKTARKRYENVLKKIEGERKAIRDMRYDEFGNYMGTADEIDNQPIEQVAAFGGRFNPIGYRYGGRRFAAGGMVPNSSDTMVAYGATHEQIDPQTGETGVPYQDVEVEGGGVVGNRALAGEVVKQDPNGDIVFSDRLYVPGSKVTYADFAKVISDRKGVIEKEIESQSAELDKALKANNKSRTTIAKQGTINRNIEKIMIDINVKTTELQQYDNKLNELYGIQEQHATAMGLRDNVPIMACGGRARRRYPLGGIVLGAQALGGLANFINNINEAKFYSKLTPPQQTRETAPEYDWRYNISSQLEDINRQVGSTRNFIEKNTSNAQVARNLIASVAIQGNAARNKLYAEKNRFEQIGRNRNIEARYKTAIRNAEKEYQNAVDKYNHSVQANSMRADATRTFITDMMGVVQTGIGLYEGAANRQLIAATSISDADKARILANPDLGQMLTGKTKDQRIEARAARLAKKGGSPTTIKSETFTVPSISDLKFNLPTGTISSKSNRSTFGNVQTSKLNLQYSRIPKELLKYRYLYDIPSFKGR